MLAQTTLRTVLGQDLLDEMLSERKKLSADLPGLLDVQIETWGIAISNVEMRTVELTENMIRAIAVPRSSTPKPSSRQPNPSSMPPESSRGSQPQCNCAICRP